MQILLTTLNAKYIHINLAIRLLYQLNKQREGLSWREFTIKDDVNEIAEACLDFEVVAFSCYIWNITQTLEVARCIKAKKPEIKILLGGPEVSYDWKNVIERDEVDFIIAGEGEIPFQQFLESYPNVENVSNLVRKEKDGVKYLPNSEMFDLAQFETMMPYSDDEPESIANRVAYIETSRGCPYKCEFCLASLDNKVRYLPDAQIKANLLYLMQHGRVIKFLDRTFNIKKVFTLDIFEFILAHHRPENVFQFEITADILHPDIIRYINERVPKGLFRFEIGIQSVNQKANLEMSRKQNFEKTTSIIEAVRDKVELHLDLIVGLPFDGWAETKYSFEEVFKLNPPELQLGFLKFLKGTPVRERYAQYGYEFDPNPPYQIIKSNFLSEQELRDIEILEHALEIYWNKKRTLHTLRYVTAKYSIFDFLLGLGKHFQARKAFHRYLLEDVFFILQDYVQQTFPNDRILQELIGIDYYLFAKIMPKDLFIKDLDKKKKNQIVLEKKLNHHQFRFLMLPLHFDFHAFEASGEVIEVDSLLVIQYDGKEKAKVLDLHLQVA